MSQKYVMGSFAPDRYTDIFIIYEREKGFIEGRVMELPGGCEKDRKKAQQLLDALNLAATHENVTPTLEDTADPTKELQPIPNTFEQAVNMCTELVIIGAGESVFERSEKEFVSMCHHNLGQRMRNAWGLWSMDSELFRKIAGETCLSHADDISGLILTATYRKFNDQEFNIREEAAMYHDHWRKMFSNRGLSVVL